jgi:hypothetical protein
VTTPTTKYRNRAWVGSTAPTGTLSPGDVWLDTSALGIESMPTEITIADSPNLDAFGRLRVSEPLTIFDSKQIFDNQPLFWDESLESGSGISSSHDADTASTVITSTVSTAGTFTRQTFMRFNYQPGKSQLILMTGILKRSGGGTGVERRVGLFDDENGLFFADNEGTVQVVRRTNVTGTAVDNEVGQTSWNIDQLDGTGPSGVTIDWTKTTIFIVDYEWLGVGRVRLGVNVDGRTYYVHEFKNANVLDKVYMSTPNLPLRYQMITTGSSPASTMEAICTSVASEGGQQELGTLRAQSTGTTDINASVDGTIYAVVGIRLKAANIGGDVNLVSASLLETAGNKSLEWLVLLNPTVTGTFTYSDITNSSVQGAIGATATVTGGTTIASGYFASGQKGGEAGAPLSNAIKLGAAIDGTVDEIVLCARPLDSSSCDVHGSLNWRESP